MYAKHTFLHRNEKYFVQASERYGVSYVGDSVWTLCWNFVRAAFNRGKIRRDFMAGDTFKRSWKLRAPRRRDLVWSAELLALPPSRGDTFKRCWKLAVRYRCYLSELVPKKQRARAFTRALLVASTLLVEPSLFSWP